MSPVSTNRRGAPLCNMNNFKYGFYSRRLKKRDLTVVESTEFAGFVEEIALIRVLTCRLVESFNPDADFYEHADILRILCVASAAITRVIRAQYLISSAGSGMDDEITEAIRQVKAELTAKSYPSVQDIPAEGTKNSPSYLSPQAIPRMSRELNAFEFIWFNSIHKLSIHTHILISLFFNPTPSMIRWQIRV
jgi:hypothetical protein